MNQVAKDKIYKYGIPIAEDREKTFKNYNEQLFQKYHSNSNNNQVNLKEIERIYFELNQERKKIRLQENKIKKFNSLLRRKDLQLEDEKNKIQKKKDCK